ncbi:MAG: OmpH family outer membrane protein [Planctomycetales bacterium]
MLVQCRLFVLVVVVASLGGCNKPGAQDPAAASSKAMGGVGVVDLVSVAKQLGRDLEIDRQVEERTTALNKQLSTLQKSLNRLYDERRAGYGEEPTEEERQQLAAMQTRMENQLLESRRKAENELAIFKQQLSDQCREQTKPVLKEVAAARGLSIVIPKNEGLLLSIDPAVEITDEVAQQMAAKQPARARRAAAPAEPETGTETSSR